MIECSKHIIDLAKIYFCSKITVEELIIESSDKDKGKRFNKLCNNDWLRNKFTRNLHKRCNISGIEFIEINPIYSSTVGNVIHGGETTPDMVASSIEIARRGFKKYAKCWFYPKMPDVERMNELWKQTPSRVCQVWKELHDWLKESKVRYRFPLEVDKASRVLRFSNIKSNILLYSFI